MSGPRSSFPPELVRQIILSCLLDPEYYTNPFDLASVCHQWRRVVKEEKSLWETLHITWITGPASQYYLLQPRMRIAPFGARARALGNRLDLEDRAQDWLARSRNDTKLSLSFETDGTEPHSLLPTLFTRYRHRLRRLSLTTSMTTVMRLLHCIQELQIPGGSLLPHLEVFEVHVIYFKRGATLRGVRQFDFREWKELRSLKLHGSNPSGSKVGLLNYRIVAGVPFTQLVCLYLEDRRLTFSEVRSILDESGRLEELSTIVRQLDDSEAPFHDSTLPTLRIMALYFDSDEDACGFVAPFFTGLYTPALKKLTIDAQYAVDEPTMLVSILSHMLHPSNGSHQIEALTLLIDLSIDPVISMLRDFPSLKYLRLCAPVRGETYFKCDYLQLLEIMTLAPSEHDFPLLEEIFLEDNVPSEIHRLKSLLAEDRKIHPDIAGPLGLLAIQSFVESRCRSENHVRCVSVTWKNAGRDWPSIELDVGKNTCPYNHPTLQVKENSVEIAVKCRPHRQRGRDIEGDESEGAKTILI